MVRNVVRNSPTHRASSIRKLLECVQSRKTAPKSASRWRNAPASSSPPCRSHRISNYERGLGFRSGGFHSPKYRDTSPPVSVMPRQQCRDVFDNSVVTVRLILIPIHTHNDQTIFTFTVLAGMHSLLQARNPSTECNNQYFKLGRNVYSQPTTRTYQSTEQILKEQSRTFQK